MPAVETGPAGDGEGGDDSVAGLEVLDVRAGGADLAGEFVAHYKVCSGGLVAAEDVEFTVSVNLECSVRGMIKWCGVVGVLPPA